MLENHHGDTEHRDGTEKSQTKTLLRMFAIERRVRGITFANRDLMRNRVRLLIAEATRGQFPGQDRRQELLIRGQVKMISCKHPD